VREHEASIDAGGQIGERMPGSQRHRHTPLRSRRFGPAHVQQPGVGIDVSAFKPE
jgi:hypothetical protein